MKSSHFNQLSIFLAIASEGSIQGAARKLRIKPPSVSYALKLLEKELGLPLFNRTTRRIELTDAGEQLFNETSDLVTKLDFALESVQDLTRQPSGKVTLTLPRFAYQTYLRSNLSEFTKLYPDIEFEISISEKMIDILKEGMDVGIRFGDRIEEGMIARRLTCPMKEAVFASPLYIDQFGVPSVPEDLAEHKMIDYRFSLSNQKAPLIFESIQGDVIIETPSALVVNDTEAMIDGALEGVGIGRMVLPAVQKYLDDGTLVPLLKEHWYSYPALYAYFPQDSQKAKRVRVLVDFLVAVFGKQNP